eukprot:353615-Chlamydomonas_euryale.AAC.7
MLQHMSHKFGYEINLHVLKVVWNVILCSQISDVVNEGRLVPDDVIMEVLLLETVHVPVGVFA